MGMETVLCFWWDELGLGIGTFRNFFGIVFGTSGDGI